MVDSISVDPTAQILYVPLNLNAPTVKSLSVPMLLRESVPKDLRDLRLRSRSALNFLRGKDLVALSAILPDLSALAVLISSARDPSALSSAAEDLIVQSVMLPVLIVLSFQERDLSALSSVVTDLTALSSQEIALIVQSSPESDLPVLP